MQFESLKVFCDVARLRSFSQAATANEMTQSAASQIVGQLEDRLGVQLIDRSTRPLQLTGVGKRYYEGCKQLVEQYLELEASIRSAPGDPGDLAATVQVAAIYSVGLGDMGELVARFEALQPHAKVYLEYLHPDRVYDKVLDGTADFGLVSFPRSRGRELTVLPWREEEMVLVCSPKHPLGQNLAVRPAELQDVKYIGFDKGLSIRREVDRFLHRQGVAVDVALEFDNIENIKKAVEIGAGVALLPEPTVRREVQEKSLVALSLVGGRLVRPLGIIHRRGQPLSAAARRFIALLQRPGQSATELNGTAAAPSPRKKRTHAGRNGTPRPPERTD